MIDSECPIWKAGQGFCWTPSAAWGCTDAELCAQCRAKPREEQKLVLVTLPHGAMRVDGTVETRDGSERQCRFCGQKNVYPTHWRKKDRMCRKKACWALFLEELERQPLAV